MCLAVPGKIVDLQAEQYFGLRHGKVEFGGIRRQVCLAFTPDARLGDYVLVHVGFALSVVNEEEARRVYAALLELNLLEDVQDAPPDQNS